MAISQVTKLLMRKYITFSYGLSYGREEGPAGRRGEREGPRGEGKERNG